MPAIAAGAPEPLGVTLREGGVNVAVVSRHAQRIQFCLFDGEGKKELMRIALPDRLGDVHYGFVEGVTSDARYGLRAEGLWDPGRGHRFDPAKLLVDPYATRIDHPFVYREELAAPRSAALDTAPWVPKAIVSPALAPVPRIEPAKPGLIYEIAVKAFTKRHPDVPEIMRGTISALAHPAVIDHLLTLGVDTVELMPLAAWIDERHLPALGLHNGWGYNPIVFMAPDPRLAPGGIEDLRVATARLHAAGIRVLLDVVFNHTGESDAMGPTLSLRGLDNALYFRHTADGRLVNDTGCGNTLALDQAPVIRLVMDAMRHWVEAAGIDGFRFDLATVMGRTRDGFDQEAPLLAAIAQDPILSSLTLIAEPWDVGTGGYRLGHFPARWHEWNDRYREDVRRFWRGDQGSLGALATRLAGSADIFGSGHRRPWASINYVAAHDGFTLRDAVSYSGKRNEANGEDNRDGNPHEACWASPEPGSDVRSLLATLFFSRGTPMLTAGDEFGRSQSGNNNAYAQDNETTWLDWENADRALIEFVAGLVRLRKAHPALASERFLTGHPDADGLADATWQRPDGNAMSEADWAGRQVVLVLYAGGDRVAIAFNGTSSMPDPRLPPSRTGFEWKREFGARSVELYAEMRSHTAGVDDEVIRRLAVDAGIDLDWWEVDGTHHVAGLETLRGVLEAMGLPSSTPSDAKESLARLRREAGRMLPRTHVIGAGEGTVLPISALSQRRKLHIASASRDPLEIEIAPGEEPRLPPLSAGYHDAWFDDAPDMHCRLIASPRGAFMPEALSGDARRFGLAAHLYALRRKGDCGIGDFETLARLGETAAKAGGAVAGINPLHHMFPADRERASPYQPSDRRFIDPIYIEIGELRQAAPSRYVDYAGVWDEKKPLLERAFADFLAAGASADFAAFEKSGGRDLELHGMFEALAEQYGTRDRRNWPAGNDLERFAEAHRSAIRFRAWLQWTAERQFARAAERASEAGLTIGFYRDLALGSAFDGGEVWADPGSFARDVSIGAPPDPFAREGQVWNLPPFSPRALGEKAFDPFIAVLSANMRHAGALRIDHILGYARQFWVPRGAEGRFGTYVKFPTAAMIAITAVESHRHRCAVIGEDLGTVPEGLRQSLAEASILSYRVLWFERDGIEFRPPSAYPRLAASCLASHDLPTFMGWRQNAASEEIVALDRAMSREGIDPGRTDWEALAAAHEFVARTPSALMLVQVDDLEGETEPLNVPGTDRERPNWRRRNRHDIDNLDPHMPVLERVKLGRRT
jgi:glycogen operon protein